MRLRLFLPLLLAAVTVSGCQVARDVAAVVEDGTTAPVPGELSADPMPCQDGRAGAFGCSNVDMVSRVPVDGFPGSSRGNDIWGWTDAATGIEYALVGLDDGTGFVSLADPERPAVLGKLPTTTEASTWRDIKTYADHAYIGSEAPGHGVQVFDLSRLRGLAADPARVFDADALYTGVGARTTSSSTSRAASSTPSAPSPSATGSRPRVTPRASTPSTSASPRARPSPAASRTPPRRPGPARPATRTTPSASSTTAPTPTTAAARCASPPTRTC